MPDISMCANKECPSANKCYRFMVKPTEYRQAYMEFKPDSTGKCEAYSEWTEGWIRNELPPINVVEKESHGYGQSRYTIDRPVYLSDCIKVKK